MSNDKENLTIYYPDTGDYEKFEEINSLSYEQWIRECVLCNDCSICHMAIHQHLLSTDKHTCVYGISREKFENLMSDSDCSFC